MEVLKPVVSFDETELIGYNHRCPGCKELHFIPIRQYRTGKRGPNPTWSFNGDLSKPTFNPSVRVFHPAHMDEGVQIPEKTLCHYFIRNGRIEYCSDSAHFLAGKSIPMVGVNEMAEENKGGLAGLARAAASESKVAAPAAGASDENKSDNQNRTEGEAKLPKPEGETGPAVVGASGSESLADLESQDRGEERTGGGESEATADEAHEEAKDKLAEGGAEAYGKFGSQDENNPLVSDDQLDAIREGAEKLSGSTAERPVPRNVQRMAEDSDQAVYSSHPIANLKIGRFQFVKGVLRLNAEDSAAFDELLAQQPPRIMAKVTKIDSEAGDRVARRFLDTRRSRGVDTAGSRTQFASGDGNIR